MQLKFFIIPALLIIQAANAQNGPTITNPQGTVTNVTATSSTIAPSSSTFSPLPESNETLIMDYKSVYEAPTLEEEVKMAAERFNLTKSQQDVWMVAGKDRRAAETQARTYIDSKAVNVNKDDAYRGLRSAQNTFYETIIGYLNPAQKQALETDRAINQEKQKRLAKFPPPPPPSTITVMPVDSAALKEPEKGAAKKSKKKKKAVGA
ncbi:MAG: hypothetical protein H0W61_01280 [Bacteroidetes bacterium]|nr:hypothetical protein [Bacteroidota bacterium]